MSRVIRSVVVASFLLTVASLASATPVVIDFEGLAEEDVLANQFAGVTFSSGTVLAAGGLLNDFEFPPQSGTNAVADFDGPITISFAAPVAGFSGFFTYVTSLTLSFYDAGNTLIGTVTSGFGSNLALSGDVGSSPNEALGLASGGGIASLTIVGDVGGGSFVFDDITITPFDTPGPAVPEPGTMTLLLVGAGAAWARKRTTPGA